VAWCREARHACFVWWRLVLNAQVDAQRQHMFPRLSPNQSSTPGRWPPRATLTQPKSIRTVKDFVFLFFGSSNFFPKFSPNPPQHLFWSLPRFLGLACGPHSRSLQAKVGNLGDDKIDCCGRTWENLERNVRPKKYLLQSVWTLTGCEWRAAAQGIKLAARLSE